MILLEARNLAHRYGAREVLKISGLQVHRGRIHAIMGPSGAGKSTLLRVLNLLESPSSGKLYYAGTDIPASGPERLSIQRRMAMVAQQPVLFNTTVEANVAYGLKVRGIRECRSRVAKALEWVGLADFGGRRAVTLSGGEAQRVAIARAAILEPEILFLDEPTANLDPSNVSLIEDLIRDVAERGTSVVLVTHNLFQARRLAHQATFLLGGQAVESGPARQVLERPREAQTLAFIEGKMVC